MSRPFTGGCACGAVRYTVSAEPVAMGHCQCRQCQRDSGTGHASHLTFAGAAVAVEGRASEWEVAGDGGTVKRGAFCPNCGSPLYITLPAMPDYFILYAGSLDEPERYRPQMVLWSIAAPSWDRVDRGLPAFDRMPAG
ncbi:GFA family protein [Mangrovicella endophytica]|uniref:GFA family protein n=1 Tax=Mangrovicella endophytica TaxID=2066697 RepID=UPI000C9DED04|nr:GFA family protein [Mangrovicella endophytica]